MKLDVFWLLLFFFWEIEGALASLLVTASPFDGHSFDSWLWRTQTSAHVEIWTLLCGCAVLTITWGVMLKCGEDIMVERGEKKKLRFWSTEDELMKVEVMPKRQKNDNHAFLAIYKDLNKSPLGSSHDPSGEDKGVSGNGSINLSSHLSSRNDVSGLDKGGKPIDTEQLPKADTKPAYKNPLEGEIHENSPDKSRFDGTTQKAPVDSGREEDKKQVQKEDFDDISGLAYGSKPIVTDQLPKANTKPTYKEPLEGEIREKSPIESRLNTTTQEVIVDSGGGKDKKQMQKEEFNDVSGLDKRGKPVNTDQLPKANTKPAYKEKLEGKIPEESTSTIRFDATTQKVTVDSGVEGDKKEAPNEDFKTPSSVSVVEHPVHELNLLDQETTREDELNEDRKTVTESNYDSTTFFEVHERDPVWSQKESDTKTINAGDEKHFSNLHEMSGFNLDKPDNFKVDIDLEADVITNKPLEITTINPLVFIDSHGLEVDSLNKLLTTTFGYETDIESTSTPVSVMEGSDDTSTISNPTELTTGQEIRTQNGIIENSFSFQPDKDIQKSSSATESYLSSTESYQNKPIIDDVEAGTTGMSFAPPKSVFTHHEEEESTTINPIVNTQVILNEENINSKPTDIPIDNETKSSEDLPHLSMNDAKLNQLKNEILLIDKIFNITSEFSQNDTKEFAWSTKYPFPLRDSDPFKAIEETEDVTMTAQKNIGETKDDLIENHQLHFQKSSNEHFVKMVTQNTVDQTTLSFVQESSAKYNTERPLLIDQQENLIQNKPLTTEEKNNQSQKPDILGNSELPFGTQELQTIMNQLKSQEDLLSRPTLKNISQAASLPTEEQNESIDLKINILKNIIKGIASKIASDENNWNSVRQNVNLKANLGLHESDLNDKTFSNPIADEMQQVDLSSNNNANLNHRFEDNVALHNYLGQHTFLNQLIDTTTSPENAGNKSIEFEAPTTGVLDSTESVNDEDIVAIKVNQHLGTKAEYEELPRDRNKIVYKSENETTTAPYLHDEIFNNEINSAYVDDLTSFSDRTEETTQMTPFELSIENGSENTTELYQESEASFQVDDNLVDSHKNNDKEQLNTDVEVTETTQAPEVLLSNVSYQMSQGIFRETTWLPLKQLDVRSDSNHATPTTESVVETTGGLMDGIKMAYNKILDGLSLSLTTVSPNSLDDVEIETNRPNISLDESHMVTEGMYNDSSLNFVLENFIADDKISDEHDHSDPYVTTTENLNYVQTSLPLSDIKRMEYSEIKLANESENSKFVDTSNMQEIFLPFNFFDETETTTIESTNKNLEIFNGNDGTTQQSNIDQTISSIGLSIKEHLEVGESTTIKKDLTFGIEEEKNAVLIPPPSNTTALLNDSYKSEDLDKTHTVIKHEDRDTNRNVGKPEILKIQSLPPQEMFLDPKTDQTESNSEIKPTNSIDKESGNEKPQRESSEVSEIKSASKDATFIRQNANVNMEHDKITKVPDLEATEETSPVTKHIININKQVKTNHTDDELKIINEDSVFSKETGSYNILSLIRNALLNQNIQQQSENNQHDNTLPLPVDLSSQENSEIPEVLIEEQGSKVFIHKPHTNLEREVDVTPHVTTTLQPRDQGGLNFEMTTLALMEGEKEDSTTPRHNIEDPSSFDDVDANVSEFSNSLLTLANSDEEQITTVSPVPKTKTTLPMPSKGELTMTSENLNRPIPTPISLTDAASDQEGGFSSFIKMEPGVIDLLQDYFFDEEATDITPNSDPSSKEEVNQNDTNHRNDSNVNVSPETPSLEQNHPGSSVELDDIPINNEPIKYFLQTRKGLVGSDHPNITHGHLPQQRRDDSPNTHQPESPFFIKLPGSPVAVPVFLQYEPVKVKYVDVNEETKIIPVDQESEIDVNKNDKLSDDVDITQAPVLQTKPEYSVVEKNPSIPQDELDFHDRPDPFYLMEPPNLGKSESISSDDLLSKDDVNNYSIDVKEKLSFNDKENVVKGEGAVYPGEYLIKNPDNSYSSSDTTYLTNSVFSLGSKIARPSPKPDTLLQYTPFPITPNPPIMTTLPNFDENEKENEITPRDSSQTPELLEETATVDTELGGPPSMLFSPAPSIDYSESFSQYDYPNLLFNEDDNVDDNLFEEASLYLPNNEKPAHDQLPEVAIPQHLQQRNDTAFNSPSDDIPPKEDENFDIVALVNFLDQNKKVWPNSKVSEEVPWPIPTWDTSPINYQEATAEDNVVHPFGASPWLVPEGSLGEGRDYSAFYSPEDIPGLDPVYFSYRSMPFAERRARKVNPEIEGILKYLRLLPLPLQKAVTEGDEQPLPLKRRRSLSSEFIYCEWNIKTEPGLYLLVTFHNLSAPYTIDCHGAYIEVERENNGYDARWCGNRSLMRQTYSRPHVIFAKTEVRITVYDNGDALKSHPTGFEAEIEVIDLFDKREYNNFLEKKASPKIRRLLRG